MLVSKEIMAILDQCIPDGSALRLPGDKLDRQLYVSVNKVLELAGGKWNRKSGAHIFDGPAIDAIEQVLLTGQILDRKQALGFFETPDVVVDRLIAMADISRGDVVLEPSAGRGAIARRISPLVLELHCVEIDESHIQTLRETSGKSGWVWQSDFLNWQIKPTFDRIVMNPPFAKFADIAHVSRALKFLQHGGKLIAVMSAGTINRQANVASSFRRMVEGAGGWFENLPSGSFKTSGTGVETCVVTIPHVEGVTDISLAGATP